MNMRFFSIYKYSPIPLMNQDTPWGVLVENKLIHSRGGVGLHMIPESPSFILC